MLDLTVAMTKKLFFLILLFSAVAMGFSPLDQTADVLISVPTAGENLKGVVEIVGTAAGDGFVSYELAYAYDAESSMTWFPIASGSQTVMSGNLGSWDTSTITDGDYALRLTIHYANGGDRETVLRPVHVRNYTYSSAESTLQPTMTGISSEAGMVPSGTETQIAQKNPAALDESEFRQTLFTGGLAGLVVVLVFFIYTLIRRYTR